MQNIQNIISTWSKYLKTIPDWQALINNIEPKINSNGKIYKLANPINRPQESFCIVDMTTIAVSEPHYHTNNEHEIYIILQGSGSVIVGEKTISVAKGDIVIIPPMTAHYTISNKLVFACINTPPFDINNYITLTKSNHRVHYSHERFLRYMTTTNLSSTSEQNGIKSIAQTDTKIYSIGISTAGRAEIRMAQQNPNCTIVATTIDAKGAQFTRNLVKQHNLEKQITVKLEDVSQPLPYQENSFDFVFARLSLHYLSKQQLEPALKELHRILKHNGKLFIIVRSNNSLKALGFQSTFDPATQLTTTTNNQGVSWSRLYHTTDSISKFLQSAGFTIKNTTTYEEELCLDFERTKPTGNKETLIEVLATNS